MMDRIKVLLFAANPRGTAPLDLPREFREIDEEVQRGTFRTAVELILVPGTRPIDLLRKLNENQPQIVHFSSHGSPDEILLESGEEDDEASGPSRLNTRSADDRDMKLIRPDGVESEGLGHGQAQLVSKSALVQVLRSCNEGNLRLVVLNACNTRPQAEALTEVVDCVVSMNRTITDRAAIKFAASFYGALAHGRSVQKAFEQGVARLSAEGIPESDTPELLMRAGVDASQIKLVGPMHSSPVAALATEAPFIVPFPRNPDFVGRDDDLNRLHASLSGPVSGPVGIRPAGLTGMGGIGKTQLVVEYVYRHKDAFPDGIFWIDAAGPLVEGFARLATDHRVKWAKQEQPRDDQIRAAFKALNGGLQALLVLDNVPDPAAIALHLLPDCIPEDLRCRVLFTTRRHDLGRFVGIEVTVLPEEPALKLLLRHPSRRAALDPSHADHDHARAIARMLGRLPLALELAGAYLGKYSADVWLEDYREGLRSDGALATLDADAAELTEADLRRVHDPAVAATISEQWASLRDESARLLLRVASLFPGSTALPIARLGLLAALGDESRRGRRSPLRSATQCLDDACLAERLEADQVRLHPLIREFACGQTPPDQVDEFLRQCLSHAASALEHFPTLEALYVERGVDALQEDLIATLGLCPPSAPALGVRVQAVLRLLQREVHHLRGADPDSPSTLFAQQVRNRASSIGIISLQTSAEQKLLELGRPHFRLQWTASRESPDLIRTLTGHGDWVSAIALCRDGHHALSGSEDCTLRFWDLQTGQLLRTFAGHEAGVRAVALCPDERHVLSASGDRTLKFWNLETGQLIRTLMGHMDEVSAVAIAHEARLALSGSRDRTLRLWDLQTGLLLRTLTGHEDGVTTVSVSSDGHHALTGSRDRTVKLWDLKTGQLLQTLNGHKSVVHAVSLSPEGRYAVSGSDDRTVKFWDLATGELLRTFAGHEDAVSAVCLCPEARHVLSGSRDRTLRLWDLEKGQLLRTFAGHENGVSAVTVSSDGRLALSGSDDRTVKLWNLCTRQSQPISSGHEGQVITVAVSADGRHALSGSYDRTLRLWDLQTGRLVHTFAGHEGMVFAVAMSSDGRHALSGSDDRTVKLWDLRNGEILRTLTGHEDAVCAVAISPDARTAVSGSCDRTLRLWDLQTGRLLQALIGHDGVVFAVGISLDGRHVVAASDDRNLRLWNLQTGTLLRTFAGPEPGESAVAIFREARPGFTGFDDRTGKLWDLATSQSQPISSGPEGPVVTVAVAPDYRHALIGSADRTLRLWDLSTGQLLQSFKEHAGPVSTIAICPDARHAVSGSDDHTLRLWNIEHRICRAKMTLDSSPLAIALAPDGQTVVVGDSVGNVHRFQIHF
jgi:WD40 repeat protein